MAAVNISTDQWLAAAKHRRTVYGLKGTSAVPDSRVEQIIEQVLSFSPSSYNTQPVRVTLVTGDKHKQFWDTIIEIAQPILQGAGEQVWQTMKGVFESHKASYGSVRIQTPAHMGQDLWLMENPAQVVFWERGDSIKEAGEKHKSAAHMFAQFGEHANGMAQIFVWTALELEGLGANLQHLQAIPPVEAAIRKFCGVTEDYSLKAHINYGDEPGEHPPVPEKLPISETLKVIK